MSAAIVKSDEGKSVPVDIQAWAASHLESGEYLFAYCIHSGQTFFRRISDNRIFIRDDITGERVETPGETP